VQDTSKHVLHIKGSAECLDLCVRACKGIYTLYIYIYIYIYACTHKSKHAALSIYIYIHSYMFEYHLHHITLESFAELKLQRYWSHT
jgi:hypothetical protein